MSNWTNLTAAFRRRPATVVTMLALVGGGVALPGCADMVLYSPVAAPPRPLASRPAETVEVYAVTPPTRPHVNIGFIEVVPAGRETDVQAKIASMRARAGEIGCDAILITSIDHKSGPYRPPSVEGSCVIYREPIRPAPVASTQPSSSEQAPAAVQPPGTARGVTSRPAVVGTAPAEVRTAPFVIAPLVTRLPPGERLWVSGDASNGWFIAVLADHRLGYVQETAVRVQAAQ